MPSSRHRIVERDFSNSFTGSSRMKFVAVLSVIALVACGESPKSDARPEDDSSVDSGVEPGKDAGSDATVSTPTTCSTASPCYYVTETGAGSGDGSSWENAYQ